MAITVTPNLTEITDCDAVTGWSPAPTASTDYYIEGTGSVGVKVSAATSSLYKYTIASAIDCTGKHIYQWMLVTTKPDSKADGGYRMYVEDSSGNYGYWYVGGYDTAAGWTCFVIDPASTPTTGSGTINVASIKYIGVQFKHTLKITGTLPNCYWDISRYGTGLTVTSGTTDAITFESIYTNDVANAYGVMAKKEGVYFVNGKLIFGGTGSENIDFVDTNQIIVFPNNSFVSSSFYGIQVLAGSGTVNFTLGAKSGTAGISGCVLKSALSTKTFSFDVSDGDIDKMQLYGTTFLNGGTVSLPANATNREVLNCNFNVCAEVIPSTCVMTNCNFISSASHAMQMSSTSHNVTASNFISCSRGVHIDTAGSYTFDALKFTGCTYDVTNSTASAITVAKNNGSNPSTAENTGGGSVTFTTAAVNTTITVKTLAGAVIEGARVLVLAADSGPMPYADTVTITNSGTTATVSHTAHGMTTGDKVQIKGASLQANNGVFSITYISSSSYSYTMASSPGSNPTGTILATYAAVFGTTNSSGVVTASRSFSSDQPITGRVRLSSSTPVYKTADFVGTIDNETGFTLTVQLIPDE